MKPIDIAVIVIVSVLAVAALLYLAIRKIKGKSGCDCGGNCSACGMCKTEKSEQHTEKPESDAACPHCKNRND